MNKPTVTEYPKYRDFIAAGKEYRRIHGYSKTRRRIMGAWAALNLIVGIPLLFTIILLPIGVILILIGAKDFNKYVIKGAGEGGAGEKLQYDGGERGDKVES